MCATSAPKLTHGRPPSESDMANRYTPDTVRSRILAFVQANPVCSTREVADAFGLNSRHIGAELSQLAKSGSIMSLRAPTGRRLYWQATGAPPRNIKPIVEVPRQTITQTWSTTFARDPLHVALFGPAPAQVAA